jgi:dephospho-CoA kinase
VGAYKVGLTGGLASGKSTVARRLAAAGIRVVDADRIVAELYHPGGAGTRAAAELVGAGALQADGSVDKVAVARRVFTDPELLEKLEAAIHPLVRQRFAELARAAAGVVVLEATLLVEAGYAPDFDLVVTVEAPAAVRLERAVTRGLDPDEARARLDAQSDGALRRAAAQVTIVNDGRVEKLHAQTDALIERLRGELEARAPRRDSIEG